MATYASLTPAQQAQVQDVVNAIRSRDIKEAQLVSLSAQISAAWAGGTSTLVNSITDTIPNTSALAGAQGVVAADVANEANDATLYCDASKTQSTGGYNSAFKQALRVKFSGINATLST